MHRSLISLCLLISLGVAAPAAAEPRQTPERMSSPAVVSPTTLPPSAPGRLAYASGDLEQTDNSASLVSRGLGTIGLDGSDQRTLTDPQAAGDTTYAGYDAAPVWSPDGERLAYTQYRTGSSPAVALIPRDGGDPQIVDPEGWGPAWSPDGRHLAWIHSDAIGGQSIAIADVATAESSIIVTDTRVLPVPKPDRPVGPLVFSPDGQSIAFTNGDEGVSDVPLFTMATSGEGLRQISHDVSIWFGLNNYSYSPSGNALMFLASDAQRPGAPQTYLTDLDGGNQRQISLGPYYAEAAAWSPAGDWIALTTNWAAEHGVLQVDLDGNVFGHLATDEFQNWAGLVFSPDGTTVYTVASPLDEKPGVSDLYAIPVSGEPTKQLTFDHSVTASTVQAIDPGAVLREFGSGAVSTAAAAVTENVDSADTLVVSPSNDFAAGLAAAPLAAKLGAPALVSNRDSLSSQVLGVAESLGASNVVLVGDLSPDVATSLGAAGLGVTRVGNTLSPTKVAAAVARHLSTHRAFLVPIDADSQGWRLPLATAGLAAFTRQPLLYTSTVSVPRTTRNTIRRQGITSVTVVGDNSDVGPRVLRQLSALGVKVHRVRISDPYAISALLADRAVAEGASVHHPVVASGSAWASSVSAPALSALLGQANLLVDGRARTVNASAAGWLKQHDGAVRTIKLVGDTRAVRPAVEVKLEQRILG